MTTDPLDGIEARNGMVNMADLLATYAKALKDQGFNRKEALTIVLGYQHALLGGVWRGDGPE